MLFFKNLIMSKEKISIVKMSGVTDEFIPTKLEHSLRRSGAKEDVIKEVIERVTAYLYEGISTKEIYKMAFSLLRKKSRPAAARYKLKKALFELGPTGFPFEKFIAEILKREGFHTKVGVLVKGHCVQHEIDVVAEKDDDLYMVECKFHNEQGRLCDVKVPLYIHSRFRDVEKQWMKNENENGNENKKIHQGWIYTNTRFSNDALEYGNCSGLKLIGWNYPAKGNLKNKIDHFGLHPITSLTTITKNEVMLLLEKGVVLCQDVCEDASLLNSIGISKIRQSKIMNESRSLCETNF